MSVVPDNVLPLTQGQVSLSRDELRQLHGEMQRFMLGYEFGLREIETKLSILRDEFTHMHDYNPIEHVSSRVKSVDSIMAKIGRRGLAPGLEVIRDNITDIAGVRVTCSFVNDAYRLFDLLTQQDDITVRTSRTTSPTRSPTATRACTRSSRCRSTSPTVPSTSRSRCSSARSPWTSGRAWSTRSTTSTTGRFPVSFWRA
jgi:hypothetical protein